MWKKKGTNEPVETEPLPVPKPIHQATREPITEEKEAVVAQLPSVQVRKLTGQDGTVYNLSTVEEVLQEIREKLDVLLERTED